VCFKLTDQLRYLAIWNPYQFRSIACVQVMDTYEVRPRKDHRGVDVISDAHVIFEEWSKSEAPAASKMTRSDLRMNPHLHPSCNGDCLFLM
jgi:hypothetical protein